MVDGYAILVYILFYIGLVATVFYIINYFTYYRKKKDPPEATDKTVTILIPAYNEEKSIDKTIESALAIDYPKNK
jgi:cellulose synthase/poly-beta-1,6-N-acetylglucosamine synthase-like glycosyltransferase